METKQCCSRERWDSCTWTRDIGPEAAMPVMEGKSILFKKFGHIDAVPICLDTKDPQEIIRIVKAIAPSFGV